MCERLTLNLVGNTGNTKLSRFMLAIANYVRGSVLADVVIMFCCCGQA